VQRTDNLTTFMCWLLWKLRTPTYWSPKGLFKPVYRLLYLYNIILQTNYLKCPSYFSFVYHVCCAKCEKGLPLPLISQSLMRSVCKRFLKQVYFHTCSGLWILFYQLMMLCNSTIVKVKVSRNGKTPNLASMISCVCNLIHLFSGMCTSCK